MEAVEFIEKVSNTGIPIIVTLIIIWAIVKFAPRVVKRYEDYWDKREKLLEEQREDSKKADARYEKMLETITTVAQQSVEVARRSNDVIEMNTSALKENSHSNELLVKAVEAFSTDVSGLKEAVIKDVELGQENNKELCVVVAKLEAFSK